MNEYPKVVIKKKNIQTLIDYCLAENIEFSVKNKPFSDNDAEVELRISDIKKALVTGMFLRENRIELDSMEAQKTVATPKKASPKKSKSEETNGEASSEDLAKIEEEESGLFKG